MKLNAITVQIWPIFSSLHLDIISLWLKLIWSISAFPNRITINLKFHSCGQLFFYEIQLNYPINSWHLLCEPFALKRWFKEVFPLNITNKQLIKIRNWSRDSSLLLPVPADCCFCCCRWLFFIAYLFICFSFVLPYWDAEQDNFY